jgi:flagellar protein FliL
MANSTLAPAPAAGHAAEPEKKSKKKLLIMVVGVLVLAFGAYYLLVMKPAATAAAVTAAPVKPELGAVVKLDPIYINLSGGHFLKLGLALQGSKSAPKDLDGSQALDSAISMFSGQDMATVADNEKREAMKKKLSTEVAELYPDGEVVGIYFTEFVMQ